MSKEEQNLELPKRKRNPDDGELDITPMIDVTFLLLAFFVVVSNMDPQASLALPVASYGDSVPDKNCCVVMIKIPDSKEGFEIYCGRSVNEETLVGEGEPDEQEAAIGEYVQNDFSEFPTKTGVLIKAEGDVTTRTIEMVKRGIARSELAGTRDLFVAVEEKN